MSKVLIRDKDDQKVAVLIGYEGAYANLSNDSGGPTMYGISSNNNPTYAALIRGKALPLSAAVDIYRRKYLTTAICKDALCDKALYLGYDVSVWGGASLRSVQRALNAMFNGNLKIDGIYGKATKELWQKLRTDKDVQILCGLAFRNIDSDGYEVARLSRQLDKLEGMTNRLRLRYIGVFEDFSKSFAIGKEYDYEDMKNHAARQRKAFDVIGPIALATGATFIAQNLDLSKAHKEIIV